MGVLTDPVFNKVVGPPIITNFMGPARFMEPPCDSPYESLLSVVDIVLISHSHYDHLDIDTVKLIGNSKLWVVPMGVKAILEQVGVTNCIELNWWDSYRTTVTCSSHAKDDVDNTSKHNEGHESTMSTNGNETHQEIEITLTPVKHWSARTFYDRNTSLWGSYVISSKEQKFFFTGDTAYCSVFKQIGERYGPFDFAAIPIGAYKPRWFMKDVHCDPAEAVMIHKDLRSKKSVGIHWGTYPLAEEDPIEPAMELARARESQDVSTSDFFTMKHGETCNINDYVGENSTDFATIQHPELYKKYLLLRHEEEQPKKREDNNLNQPLRDTYTTN